MCILQILFQSVLPIEASNQSLKWKANNDLVLTLDGILILYLLVYLKGLNEGTDLCMNQEPQD